MKKNNTGKFGFTLIEMLVVIAIIALLAGLLFPAVSSALNTAKKAKAQTAAQNIETAVMVYSNEYNGRLPIEAAGYSVAETTDDSKNILIVLMNLNTGVNSGYELNPKRITFLETDIPSDDGTYKDPWGTQYRILLDRNLDGKINYLNKDFRKKAIVISAGKDRDFDKTSDNVANVEPN